MNILYLHRTQGKGVEGVHIWGIANGFKHYGHQVRVISPAGVFDSQPVELPNAVEKTSHKSLLSLLSKWLPEIAFEFAEMVYNYVSSKQIIRSTQTFRPDLIFERYAIFAIAGMRFAKKNRIPLMLEVNYTSCSPLVRKRSALLKPFAKYIDSKLFDSARGIVVVSSFLREHLINDYGVDPKKILVCPNAADPSVFTPDLQAKQEIDGTILNGKKVIGFVGTFSPWHGVSLLIDAFERVAREIDDAVILLVGDGPEKETIKQKVKNYNLLDKVFFVGTVSHDKLPEYVSTFSIGVMPDSNEYGSPMKIFEYMAMGKPVVVPDYSPLKDAVEDGKQGLIFKRKNIDSLANCIVKILKNQEIINLMSGNARMHIEKEHNWLANAKKNLDFAADINNSPIL